mmetsp:Transcript_60140/g.130432  ORF Transcript_60140/g.130432 Transcript_60140/m.130432 type:complete len:298 (+) Transcript_60140:217-1110(+)
MQEILEDGNCMPAVPATHGNQLIVGVHEVAIFRRPGKGTHRRARALNHAPEREDEGLTSAVEVAALGLPRLRSEASEDVLLAVLDNKHGFAVFAHITEHRSEGNTVHLWRIAQHPLGGTWHPDAHGKVVKDALRQALREKRPSDVVMPQSDLLHLVGVRQFRQGLNSSRHSLKDDGAVDGGERNTSTAGTTGSHNLGGQQQAGHLIQLVMVPHLEDNAPGALQILSVAEVQPVQRPHAQLQEVTDQVAPRSDITSLQGTDNSCALGNVPHLNSNSTLISAELPYEHVPLIRNKAHQP